MASILPLGRVIASFNGHAEGTRTRTVATGKESGQVISGVTRRRRSKSEKRFGFLAAPPLAEPGPEPLGLMFPEARIAFYLKLICPGGREHVLYISEVLSRVLAFCRH